MASGDQLWPFADFAICAARRQRDRIRQGDSDVHSTQYDLVFYIWCAAMLAETVRQGRDSQRFCNEGQRQLCRKALERFELALDTNALKVVRDSLLHARPDKLDAAGLFVAASQVLSGPLGSGAWATAALDPAEDHAALEDLYRDFGEAIGERPSPDPATQ